MKYLQDNFQLEFNKLLVRAKHPSIDNIKSKFAVIFLKRLKKNPHWLTMPDGPLRCMRSAERFLLKKKDKPTGEE